MWGRPGDSNLEEEKEHGSRWFVFARRLKAFSSARRLRFFATFSGKAPEVGKRRAGHLKAKVSPKKLFPKLALQRRLEYPGRERCKLPPGPGGGAGACAPWRGARAAGTAAPRARRARCALDRARQTGGRGASRSVRLPARSPLWASSTGCELRLLRLSLCNEAGGWAFFPLFARVCLCVRAKYPYLGNERWALAARGEPSGRQRGRLRAHGEAGGLLPAAGGEVATLSAVPAFIKEKGECERWVETAFPLLAESQYREGGRGAGAPGGPEARMGCLGVSKSPTAPPPRNLVPGKVELGATKRWASRHSVCGLVSSPRGWGQGCLQGRWLAEVQARTSRTRHLHRSIGMVVKDSGSADPALVLSSWVTLGKSLPFCAPPSCLKVG